MTQQNSNIQSKNIIIAICSILFGIILDQWTKILVLKHLKDHQPIDIIKGVFQLQYLENRGAAFGIMQGQKLYFLISGIIIIAVVSYLYLKLPESSKYHPLRICAILLVSGAIGNMIDRIYRSYVVDFLYFELINFPIFNVADIYVTVATLLLIILIVCYYKEDDLNFLTLKKPK